MKIAYIMSRFPLLSETFILREMDEVETQGGEIVLYPLICQEQDVTHQEAGKWLPRRECIPFLSFEVLKYAFIRTSKSPLKILSLLFDVVRGNLSSPKFLLRALTLFPKSLLAANRIKQANVDHIHVHYASHPAMMAYIISRLEGIGYSITIHSHDIYDNHAMLKEKLDKAKFLVTISDYNVHYLENLLGPEITAKTHVIHCGVDPELYTPFNHSDTQSDLPYRILQIGSLHWKKGQVYLLHAAKLLADQGLNFTLEIIGDGPERKNIEQAIQTLGIEKYVTLHGAMTQTNVRSMLSVADCYVQSSVSEGIPVSLMEALACELPVVATDIMGIPEIVKSGQTGILVPPRDPEALANAILDLWHNPAKGKVIGQSGRQLVVKEFNLAVNVEGLVRLFHKYVSAKGN